MPPRKRTQDDGDEPVAKRRSSRQAAAAAAASTKKPDVKDQASVDKAKKAAPSRTKERTTANEKGESKGESVKKTNRATAKSTTATTDEKKTPAKKGSRAKAKKEEDVDDGEAKGETKASSKSEKVAKDDAKSSRAVSEDPDIDSIPTTNPDAPRHDGEWYWLMKAEPESRFENGIDVRFSIDDLRSREKPEGWDGEFFLLWYKSAFFYHSNCKEPGIAGVMEIVKEFSEDKSARRPGTPYYDPQSSKDNIRWSLVHVEFRKKFAVPIGLKELRELGKPGGPLENMMMLKQGRLSVSRVSAEEWKALNEIADKKAQEAGLKHETTKLVK
ncbi:thymocyte nuclear protein 1 [Trichoderma asperellum]|uniref:Thymocyte nuclear protein 1 n=1 Tax=Trichoderma asperellum TaxID=101201 RepID=A0A6V8QQ42_TRIAP|nr:thymocyte nuclear protein 1 [Trichoderma asperellum]